MKKRLFAVFLASALLFAVLPLSVSALTADDVKTYPSLHFETIAGESAIVLDMSTFSSKIANSRTKYSKYWALAYWKYQNWWCYYDFSVSSVTPSVSFQRYNYNFSPSPTRYLLKKNSSLNAFYESQSGVYSTNPTGRLDPSDSVYQHKLILSPSLAANSSISALVSPYVYVAPTDNLYLYSLETSSYYPDIPKLEHKVTVQYQYPDGTQAAPEYVQSIPEGETYSVSSPAISGYTPDKAEVSGTMGKEDVFITVSYVKDPVFHTLTVHYRFEDGTQAAPSHSEQVEEGKPYSVNSPVMDGYTVNPGVVFGTMGESDLAFQVVYTPVLPPPVSSEESSSSGSGSSPDIGGGSSSGGGGSGGGTTTLPTPDGGTVTIPIPDTDNPLIVFSGQSIANSALTLSENISSAATFAVCAFLVITGFILVFRLVKRLFR